MKAVVGLGNPGSEYQSTRHNVGFDVLSELARRYSTSNDGLWSWLKKSLKPNIKFEGELQEIFVEGEKVQLLAPLTYMNESGRSVRKLVDFYQLGLDDLLVVCDDMNLGIGRLRLRGSGSAGGQKGLNHIIQRMGDNNIPRLRIGIGRPPGRMNTSDFVLSRFRGEEKEIMAEAIARAADGIEKWVRGGLDETMNWVNAPEQNPQASS